MNSNCAQPVLPLTFNVSFAVIVEPVIVTPFIVIPFNVPVVILPASRFETVILEASKVPGYPICFQTINASA